MLRCIKIVQGCRGENAWLASGQPGRNANQAGCANGPCVGRSGSSGIENLDACVQQRVQR